MTLKGLITQEDNTIPYKNRVGIKIQIARGIFSKQLYVSTLLKILNEANQRQVKP